MLPTFASTLRAMPAASAAAAGDGPSNQQIIDSAKAAYSEYQSAVDSMTVALVNTVSNASMASALQKLDATNWQSPGVPPSVTDPFWASSDVMTFMKTARQTSNLSSASIGAFASPLPGSGEPGMIGFGRALSGSAASTGLTLSLNIFSSIVDISTTTNLQYALWLSLPDQLHDNVTGLFIETNYQGVSLILKILLTPTLTPYGFAVSSGTSLNLPVTSGVFAGQTAQWKS